MKICIVSKYMRSLKTPQGGVERHISGVVRGLTERGHEIVLVTSKNSIDKEEASPENLKVHRLNINVKSHGNPLSRKIFCKKAIDKVSNLNKTENFDIVNIQGNFPLEVVNVDIPNASRLFLYGILLGLWIKKSYKSEDVNRREKK